MSDEPKYNNRYLLRYNDNGFPIAILQCTSKDLNGYTERVREDIIKKTFTFKQIQTVIVDWFLDRAQTISTFEEEDYKKLYNIQYQLRESVFNKFLHENKLDIDP